MKISYYFTRAREYGLKKTLGRIPRMVRYYLGVLKSSYHRKKLWKKLNKKSDKSLAPIDGFTLIADFTNTSSLSKTMRDFALCLREVGIPYQTYNTANQNQIASDDLNGVLTPRKDFDLHRYSYSADMFVDIGILTSTKTCVHSHISFWEFEDGFKDVNSRLYDGNVVLAFSDFNAELFKREAMNETRVRKIRYPFRFEKQELLSIAEVRQKYGLANDDFVVFFNFDYYCYYRKNPGAIVRAFALALKDEASAKLVFKTKNARSFPLDVADLKKIAHDCGVLDQIVFIDDFIPQKDIYSLTNASDVYISLHRGEGFGLGIVEAMSLGKPVIVTDYSSTTEFCKSDHALLVPYALIPFDRSNNTNTAYFYVSKCAEADVNEAAQALRKCYDERAWASELGRKGKVFVEDYFSPKNFKKSVLDFFESCK